MHGFTENYIRVGVQYDPLLIHESKRVKLTGLNEHGVMLAEEIEYSHLTARHVQPAIH